MHKQKTVDHNLYATRAYANARDKGFWDAPRDPAMIVLLIVSEISEALEADRKNLKDDKLTDCDGYIAEMADVYIRLADLLGSFDGDGHYVDIPEIHTTQTKWEFMISLVGDCMELYDALQSFERGEDAFVWISETIHRMLDKLAIGMQQYGDFMEVVDAKMDFNEKRPHKHGKKY